MSSVAVPRSIHTLEERADESPYKGLTPYVEADYDFFFGRERETEIICANVTASRLTLLYGESGVGKSSVLLAGAVHKLGEEARRNLGDHGQPEFAVAVLRAWRDDPIEGLLAVVAESVTALVGGPDTVDVPPDATLADTLRAWSERVDGDLVLILDQFEEYFLYHESEDGDGTFAVEFPRAVNRLDLRVSFLISMREDSLAKLDLFKGRIPNLFDNRLRIDHLHVDAARTAIEGPIRVYNERVEEERRVEVEPTLVDEVLRQIGGSHVQLGQVGVGDVNGTASGLDGNRVEAPYLQVVLRRLWLEELGTGSRCLCLETLERLGGAENIVRKRLDESMAALAPDEREVAAKVFHYLVTRSGTKVAHTASDLAEFAELPEASVTEVVEHMAGSVRVLRPVQPPPGQDGGTRYEIFHDVIGPAILDWRARYVQEQAQRQALKSTRRRLVTRVAYIAGLVFFLVAIGVFVLAYFAFTESQRAKDLEQEARARGIADQARAELAIDPARSLATALSSLAVEHTASGEAVLRQATAESRVRAIMPAHLAPPAGATVDGQLGPRVAIPAAENAVTVRDARTGEVVSQLEGHEDAIGAIGFDASGARAVTGSSDQTARVWDVASGDELAAFSEPREVFAAALDPSGQRVASGGAGGVLHLWAAGSGDELGRRRTSTRRGFLATVSFSRDGQNLLTVNYEPRVRSTVRVWPVGGGRLGAPVVIEAGNVSSAELSPDGTQVVTAGEDNSVRLWDATTGEAVRTLTTERRPVEHATFSPDGTFVAAAQEKAIHVWETGSGQAVSTMSGHRDWVNFVAFRDDGENVLSASGDGTARVWETRTGLQLFELRGHTDAVLTADYITAGTLAVTAGDDRSVRTWDVTTGLELRLHDDWVMDAVFSRDGSSVVTAGADGQLGVWAADTGSLQATEPEADAGALNSVAFNPAGDELVTGGGDATAKVWDASTLEEKATLASYLDENDDFLGHTEAVTGAAFSPDGQEIVTASQDWTARVWDPTAEEETRFLTADPDADFRRTHEGPVTDAQFTSDGKLIVTVAVDAVANVWAASGALRYTFDRHSGIVYSVSPHPSDPQVVVTGSRDRTVRIWNVTNGTELAVLRQPEAVTSTAFDAEGDRIVTGSPSGTTRVWDWRSQRLLGVMRMQSDYVNSAEFSPDGLSIVSTSDDRTAKIYECESCGPLEELQRLARERLSQLGLRPA